MSPEQKCIATRCNHAYTQENGQHVAFPEQGYNVGEHGLFRCNKGFAMKPSAFSPLARPSVHIICSEITDKKIRKRVTYTLDGGADIPQCEIKRNKNMITQCVVLDQFFSGCATQSDCDSLHQDCDDGICKEKSCSMNSPIPHSSLLVNSDQPTLGKDALLVCDNNYVLKKRGSCQTQQHLSCIQEDGISRWKLKFNTREELPQCVKGN